MTEYELNEDFKVFVDKFCFKHKITPEEAVQHCIVKGVEEEYSHKRRECVISFVSRGR